MTQWKMIQEPSYYWEGAKYVVAEIIFGLAIAKSRQVESETSVPVSVFLGMTRIYTAINRLINDYETVLLWVSCITGKVCVIDAVVTFISS